MNWWGKLIGGTLGLVLLGPLGALLGAAIGHGFDKGMTGLEDLNLGGAETEEIQAAFFTATFTIMGRIAKADGQVSSQEIAMAEQTMARMQLNADQKKAAINLFNQGKAADFNYQEVIQAFAKACGRRRNLVQMFIEIQIATALADGELESAEQAILYEIASQLKINRSQFERLLTMAVAQQRFYHQESYSSNVSSDKLPLNDAYDVLGLQSSCTDQELKKAYRKLMSQHHPDKLVSKGLPEEMMKLATEKTQKIKEAYELIKQQRQTNRG